MKVEYLSFTETQALVDAEYVRKDLDEASYKRLSFQAAHMYEDRSLEKEAWYQTRLRTLLEEEAALFEQWKRLIEAFTAEMQVKFNQPEPTEGPENIIRVLSGLETVPFKY